MASIENKHQFKIGENAWLMQSKTREKQGNSTRNIAVKSMGPIITTTNTTNYNYHNINHCQNYHHYYYLTITATTTTTTTTTITVIIEPRRTVLRCYRQVAGRLRACWYDIYVYWATCGTNLPATAPITQHNSTYSSQLYVPFTTLCITYHCIQYTIHKHLRHQRSQ